MNKIEETDIPEDPRQTEVYTGRAGTSLVDDRNLKMEIYCKNCGNSFDSTFTVDEFSSLSEDQYKSGTLHLCPHCGVVAIYTLNDYREPKRHE